MAHGLPADSLGAPAPLITQLTDAAERGAQERRLHSQGRRPDLDA